VGFGDYRRNVYSQNGEDGVIEEVCRRLGITTGWFCEFGAWDGRYGSNCYRLLREGWRGVMIEGEPSRFRRLLSLKNKFPEALVAIEAYVDHEGGKNSLDNLLAGTPIPQDFQVLSIDIDSYDYQIWRGFEKYTPAIVIIEVESSILPGIRHIYQGGPKVATSFTSMLELGKSKGYTLIAHTGNMIFVRSDLASRLALSTAELENPESMFCAEWVDPSAVSTFVRKLRHLTLRRFGIKIQNALIERLSRK
jgi:hypothetical protein